MCSMSVIWIGCEGKTNATPCNSSTYEGDKHFMICCRHASDLEFMLCDLNRIYVEEKYWFIDLSSLGVKLHCVYKLFIDSY